ncbi:uncharacterized protein [Eurosta solidaginis]|uniref:uncharacterized protein n=1 Tax=Eurosta solidaginis TaxID=178769 RepID=UPI0035317AE8
MEKTHQKKLQRQIFSNIQKFGIRFNEDWFINTTKIEIPQEYRWILSLGYKFSLPVSNKNFSPLQVIAELEQGVQKIEDDRTKDSVRSHIAMKINNYQSRRNNNAKDKLLLKTFENTKEFISKYKDEIVLTQADKGNKTVLMYKNIYEEKMKKLLDDRNVYKKIQKDPTQQLMRKNNLIINEMFKQNEIELKQKFQLSSVAAIAPRIYGLPKIHKKNMPLRPIVSSTKVPCYNLSKHIGVVLKNIISEEYNIKNSFQLKENLKNIHIEDDEILISFDVVSLFTNIPIHLAIQTIMKKWPELEKHTKISKKRFQTILEFCLRENNYFMYNSNFYQQMYGMPMGNPLSPTIADIVLDKILDDSIAELKTNDIYIRYIKKYVDDIFAIIKKKDAEDILKILNAQHTKIKFTMEIEQENEIAFLDLKVIHKNRKCTTKWYTKTIASGRIINYHSNHPWKQKLNTAKNLIRKSILLTDHEFMPENKQKIKKILYNNSYPHKLIDKLIENVTNKIREDKKETQKSDEIHQKYIGVTFIPGLTDNQNLHKIMQIKNVNYAHKPNFTLRNIFTKTKDPVEKEQQNNVVYQIKCNGKVGEKCDQYYIGTTKRQLGIRLNEHRTDAKNKKMTTALAQHLTKSNHTADFDHAQILDIEKREKTRLTLESLRIQQKIHQVMNFKEDANNISNIYTAVVQRAKKQAQISAT